MANKAVWKKEKGLCFRHYVQSFHPDERITPKQANELGLEFAKQAWRGYGILVATHCDREHVHNHFVIDTVHMETGKKLHEDRHNMEQLRKINDKVCSAYNFSVLVPYENRKTKSISMREYRSGSKRESWKFRLRASIKYAMEHCGTKNEFILQMDKMGYEVRWEDNRKNITYTCFKEAKYKNGAYRKCNDDKLADEKYLKEVMEYEFKHRQEILTGRDDEYARLNRRRNYKRNAFSSADERRLGGNTIDAISNATIGGTDANGIPQDTLSRQRKPTKGEGDGERLESRSEGTHQESTRTDGQSLSANASGVRKTGWETERGIYFAIKEKQTARKTYVLDKHSMLFCGIRPEFLLSGAVGFISTMGGGNGEKTPEEIEAEERARLAGQNFATAVELIKLGAEFCIKKYGQKEVEEKIDQYDREQEMKL